MSKRYADAFSHTKNLSRRGPLGDWQRSTQQSPTLEDASGKPHTTDMNEVTREEIKARLEGSEARVAATIAEMRTENARFLGELNSFKNDLSTMLTKAEARSETQSASIEQKLSGLKIWVLTGALAGVLALLSVVVTGVVRYALATIERPQAVQTIVEPEPLPTQTDAGRGTPSKPAPNQESPATGAAKP